MDIIFSIIVKPVIFCLILFNFLSCNYQPHRPNVIYIAMEDMSPIWGAYGNEILQTPNLDDFASNAVLFMDCHCQVALCTPSRTCILTGIRPSTSGMVKIDDDWQAFLPGAASLPRHFRDNGYFTYKVGKISDPRNGGMDSAWITSKEPWGVTDNRLPLAALDEVASQKKPFFLAIGYKQTHEPWNPSEQALKKYNLEDIDIVGPAHQYKGKTLTDLDIKELLRNYYASLTDVDSLVGEIIAKTKELGLFGRSIILVGAMDHGFSLGVHNKWGKGGVYDNETQVPLAIRIPGNPKNGSKASGIIELVDIYPTLVDVCNLPRPPQTLEGYNFSELLYNPQMSWKKAAFSHRAYAIDIVGIKTKKYTSVHYPDGKTELYNRTQDPKNLKDISDNNVEIVKKHKTLLEKGWKEAVPVPGK